MGNSADCFTLEQLLIDQAHLKCSVDICKWIPYGVKLLTALRLFALILKTVE